MWQVFAIKYAERNSRTRVDSFLDDPYHASPHDMDYYIWVLRSGDQVILVDTGYDAKEAALRGRPIDLDPREALQPLGLKPEDISTIIVTHLHYDHAGGLALFPNAHIHLQAAEMQFATGPCMCDPELQAPFTGDHVCEVVQRLYSGKLTFHTGSAQIASGVKVHCIGGHSRGLQIVEVLTETGPVILASDAAHYYENFLNNKLFPIVADKPAMLAGFKTLRGLSEDPRRIIPGHDPLVRKLYPEWKSSGIYRLDTGPIAELPR